MVLSRETSPLTQRGVFPAVHAGGGLNIQATVVARRLGIGRNTREEAAVIESAAG